MRAAAIVAMFAGAAMAASAQVREGRVTHVVDGDTLDVLVSARRLRLRLADIDAPERDQRYGLRSRQSLIALCGGELATIEVTGRDGSGLALARVACAGRDAGAEQLRLGMAWVLEHHSRPESPLRAVQQEAREARRGLWADGIPVPPWEWRRVARAGGK